jgi:hypothetical protein
VDVVTLTKANCASPINYFDSLVITLVTFKAAVAGAVLAGWLVPKVKQLAIRLGCHRVSSIISVSPSRAPRGREVPRTRRRMPIADALQTTDWIQVFRGVFMLLFIAYPSVSVKIFRLFKVYCALHLYLC